MPNQHIGLVDARLHLLALLEGMVRAGTHHYCITVCVVCCVGDTLFVQCRNDITLCVNSSAALRMFSHSLTT
jgi:hypothetical protein